MAEDVPQFEWSAYEHEHFERSSEWFWIVGIIAVALAIASMILGNPLFGALILISAFLLAMFAVKKPNIVIYQLSAKGIRINNTFYPFRALNSFFVTHGDPRLDMIPKLLVSSSKPLMPLMSIPLDPDMDPDDVRDFMLQFLSEEEHKEPIAHHLLALIGL